MSAKIRDEIRNHGQIETEDMGLFNLKNVEEPVRLYAVSSDDLSVPIPAEMPFRVDPAEFNLPSEAVVGQWSAKVFMDAATPILIENLEGVVLDANPEAERRYGFTRHELIGKPIKMLVPPEQHAQADDLLHRCRAGEEVRNVEGLRWTKSEEVLSVLLTLSALRDELGETVAIATIAVDITALKAAQEALRVERETLDVRVSERTHDLTEARARLQAVTDHLREHVSPEVYKSIVEHPGDQATEPRRKWLTVFFSDIADFATISGEMDADELGAILNEYFQEMTHIISKHGGTVDRYLGDTIFLIFGDPTSQGEQQDALACVSAALEMQDRMSALREEWSGRGLQHPFRPRMGVSSGQCTLGMFGSDLQRSYSILGRHVSLAKKLQRNAAPDQILVSKSTWSLVNDRVTCEPSAPVQANGFAEPVEVFRVVEETEPNAASGTLHRSGPGFSLWLDPEASSAEDRVATVRDLRQALARLEELGDEDPLG
jgi:PAS domain S-box-containing protein